MRQQNRHKPAIHIRHRFFTKISFPPFSAPWGPLTPKRGKTHPEPEYASMQNLAWIGPRVVEKSLTKNEQKTYSKTNTSPFALTSEWRVTRTLTNNDSNCQVNMTTQLHIVAVLEIHQWKFSNRTGGHILTNLLSPHRKRGGYMWRRCPSVCSSIVWNVRCC